MKEKSTLSRVLRLIRPYAAFAVLMLICAFISAGAALLIPIFCGNAVDAMLGKGNVDFAAVIKQIIIIGVVALVAALAQYLLSLFNNRMTFCVCRDLRNKISEKIHLLPISYIDSHQTGDIVSRAVSDIDTFADGLLVGFTQLFTGIITIVATLGIMFYLNFSIALAVMLLTPLSVFVARFIAVRTHKFFKEQAEIRGEETALINELIDGGRVVKAFGHEKESMKTFDSVNARLQKASLNATFFSSLPNPSTRLVNNIVYAVVILLSALYATSGGISIGLVSVFLSYASGYAKPFNEISNVITELQNALACAKRVFDLLDEENMSAEPTSPENPEPNGNIELKNVSFSYTKEKPLISDLNLNVSAGERIAIVGPTGCGKTTLINLLMRFYDIDSGEIKVDGANIADMTRQNLRARYGMVLQDTWLCAGTIRENIAYGNPSASDEEIENAAKASYAYSFIRRMPNGFDTVIKENGTNLSAGQRQLLCIARAMLCLPPMLILDEATSSIDTRTEMKIQSAFSQMMKGRTCFIVAHRLSTVKEANVTLVMKDGKVIEQGNHKSLLAEKGFYYKLYNSQFCESV